MNRFLPIFILVTLMLFSCQKTKQKSQESDKCNQEQCDKNFAQSQCTDGEKLLNLLNADSASLIICNHELIKTYSDRGVNDLIKILREDASLLDGALVADKMVGKAAAALMIMGKVREVHTNLICTPAKQMFEDYGIKIYATKEVPMILNRYQTGQCPIDSKLNEATTPEECVQILIK